MRILPAVLPIALLICTFGCTKRAPKITVGSKFGTEQAVLGEIISQQLERRLGVQVNRRFGIGDTDTLQQALISGEVDLYPEYTGTAMRNVLKLNMEHDTATVYEQVRDQYAAQYQVICLPPFGFDSAVLAAIALDRAEKYRLQKMSDLDGNDLDWKIAYTGSFGSRPDGLPSFIAGYSPNIVSAPLLLDTKTLFGALDSKLASLIIVRATDGPLGTLKAALLGDDRLVFPPYQGFIALRKSAASAQPQLRDVLLELSGRIDTPAMQRLNAEVELEHKSPAQAAHAFLERAVVSH